MTKGVESPERNSSSSGSKYGEVGGIVLNFDQNGRAYKNEEFRGFVYTRAAAADNFIYISTGLPSDVHGYKKNSGRALCARAE